MCWAAIIRSPSFSREGESRTTRNWPWAKEVMQDSMGSKVISEVAVVVGAVVKGVAVGSRVEVVVVEVCCAILAECAVLCACSD